jgi:hypothetical protein
MSENGCWDDGNVRARLRIHARFASCHSGSPVPSLASKASNQADLTRRSTCHEAVQNAISYRAPQVTLLRGLWVVCGWRRGRRLVEAFLAF